MRIKAQIKRLIRTEISNTAMAEEVYGRIKAKDANYFGIDQNAKVYWWLADTAKAAEAAGKIFQEESDRLETKDQFEIAFRRAAKVERQKATENDEQTRFAYAAEYEYIAELIKKIVE